MLVVMKSGCTREEIDRVLHEAEALGSNGHVLPGDGRVVVGIAGDGSVRDPARFRFLPGVARVVQITPPYRLAALESRPAGTSFSLGSLQVGGGGFAVVAGPCAVESEDQILSLARFLKESGADMLRGGAFKPRSSPYSFQGLGEEALRMLARARKETGLPVVTEAIDEASLELVAEYADVIQIGARNMRNYPLLRRAGRSRRPVFLKRGMSASLDDLLMSAEHVMNEGNEQVILCERGIRTFSRHCRFTLDLSVVPAIKEASHLPVFVDPSHGTGHRDRVPPMARAALAAGADGVMVEVHGDPRRALSDGTQALLPAVFSELVHQLRGMEALLHGRMETVS
jgi:3-deoxy-7-phosphoheptulonate synthase